MAVYQAFAEQIRKFARSADVRANLVVKKILFDLSTSIILKSPVGDPKHWKRPAPPGYVGGRFRANWQYGGGNVNITTTQEKDKSGSPTISKVTGAIPERVIGVVHYITNSLPYANRLEDGWSWQAPPGYMVKGTILEFDRIVRMAAAELS